MRGQYTTESSSSDAMDPLKLPSEILRLGAAITRELGLNKHIDIVGPWMAHHLAELMQVAKDAEGRDKELAQEKAVDLILKLWAHRRDLPSNAYPINRIDTVISVIERLRTSTSPFHRNQGSEIEQFLSRIYSGLQTVAINGIVLTSKTTEIPDELKAVEPILDEEERRIVEAVHYWIDLIKTEHTMPQIEMKYVTSSHRNLTRSRQRRPN